MVRVWGFNHTEAAMYVNTAMCNHIGGGESEEGVSVGLNQKQYIIKGMTCGIGLHRVYHKGVA